MRKGGNLLVLIDSKNFLENYNANPDVMRILKYVSCGNPGLYKFIRTPHDTGIAEIDNILHFTNMFDQDEQLAGIELRNNINRDLLVTTDLSAVDVAGKEIFHKETLSSEEWQKIWNVFVHHSLIYDGEPGIFVTEDAEILRNRSWFEDHIPGEPLNITSVQEAMEIMDLYAKNLDQYQISPNNTANPGLWYWQYFRILVPHYNVPRQSTSPLAALSTRFVFLLQSIDRMGVDYYAVVDNDTGSRIQYHFNYFVMLTTGIFDSLARAASLHYNIELEPKHGPSNISLRSGPGKKFLKEIRGKNSALREHIKQNAEFINLIYGLRDIVAHQNFQTPVTYGRELRNVASLLTIPQSLARNFPLLHDEKRKYDDYSLWGVYHIPGTYLSPYEFSKQASKTLLKFSDRFLHLLGFEKYFHDCATNDKGDLLELKTSSLGFRTLGAYLEGPTEDGSNK